VSSLGDRQSTFATESRAKLLGKLLWHGWWQTSAVVACRLQLITMVHNWSRGVFGITPFSVFLLFTLIPSRCLPPSYPTTVAPSLGSVKRFSATDGPFTPMASCSSL